MTTILVEYGSLLVELCECVSQAMMHNASDIVNHADNWPPRLKLLVFFTAGMSIRPALQALYSTSQLPYSTSKTGTLY